MEWNDVYVLESNDHLCDGFLFCEFNIFACLCPFKFTFGDFLWILHGPECDKIKQRQSKIGRGVNWKWNSEEKIVINDGNISINKWEEEKIINKYWFSDEPLFHGWRKIVDEYHWKVVKFN